MNIFRSMAKKTTEATFDAIVNANNAITIPEATRLRLRIVPGVNVKITIETDE
jgi:bifunctional DNA-binding transcriptional regulator/antitoxin component of YhaV-PrlF toxin-antitoxin module